MMHFSIQPRGWWLALTLLLFVHPTVAVTKTAKFIQIRNLLSSNCTDVRPPDEYYADKLDLFYAYSVECGSTGTAKSLAGLELAITSVVVELLANECDMMDRPMYKVKSDAKHYFAHDDFCVPQTVGNPCYVVNGVTSILLDRRSAHIQERVYGAIALGLENSERIRSFAPSVLRAEFQKSLGESLTGNSLSYRDNAALSIPVTATIAVAAASVSVALVSIFGYGLMHRELRQHPDPSIRHKFRRSARSLMVMHGTGIGSPQRQRRFSRLDDLANGSEGPEIDLSENHVDDAGRIYRGSTPSIIWSVSDITSDSGSIHSGISLTVSRLERIEEGEEHVEESDEDRWENVYRRKLTCVSPEQSQVVDECSIGLDRAEVVTLELLHISTLDDNLDEDLVEPEGGRSVPEGTRIKVERIEESTSSHAWTPGMLDVEHLEIIVDIIDEEQSISSALSISSEEEDNFIETNAEIKDGSSAANVSEKSSNPKNSHEGSCEVERLSQAFFDYSQVHNCAPLDSEGDLLSTQTLISQESEENCHMQSPEIPSSLGYSVDVSFKPLQWSLMDRAVAVDDSLEWSIASSNPSLPRRVPPPGVLTKLQDPPVDTSADDDVSMEWSTAGSSSSIPIRLLNCETSSLATHSTW